MSSEFKANNFKVCGQRLHDEVYSNIHILMLVYRPSLELKNVFKKDMFVKANKHAFHQVAYYLLGIIDPEKLRKKIRMWPILETRFEAQFRTEIIEYINELSILHKGFDIPEINKSHVVVPGGFKFARLMFKLSNLALSQHIQRTSDFRCYLKPTQALSCNPELTEKATNGINARAQTVQENLRKSITEAQEAAENGAVEIKQFEKNCAKLKNELKLSQEKFNRDFPEFNMDVFEAKMQRVMGDSRKLLHVRQKYEMCKNLMEHLQSDKAVFEFDVETFPNTNNIVHEGGTLDIVKLLTRFNQTMNELCLEIQSVSDEELLRPMEQFTEHCKRLQIIDTNYNGTLVEMNDFKSTLKGSVFLSLESNETTDSELANPLPETPP